MAAAISQISASITLFSHFHIKFTPVSGRMMTGGGRRGRAGVVRSEQSSDQGSGSGVDVWLGRFAMVVAALGVEVGTGKGLLESRLNVEARGKRDRNNGGWLRRSRRNLEVLMYTEQGS
ncbi:hypothetical protein Droror1_Dr00002741 [Drosera rotundifolia]